MATESQILANRANALRGAGPRTPERRAVSSANAVRHGLAAGFRVVTNENQEEFDKLAQSRWRLARACRLEAAVVEQQVGLADPAEAGSILAAGDYPVLRIEPNSVKGAELLHREPAENKPLVAAESRCPSANCAGAHPSPREAHPVS